MAERTFCTQCGCESDPAAPAQCPRCGAALELPPSPPQSVSSPAPQASTATSARSWLLIGCLAGLLFAVLVVAVGGWLLYRHLSPSRPQQTQSPDAVPSQQAPIESVSKKPSDTAPQQPRQELRRLLQPSTEPQRVEMEGMAVLVPGGLLAAPRELTIASIPQPPSPGDGLQVASAYDIRLGDQHLFEKPLTIELPYDPASLRPGTTPKHALMAAWWDESQKDWCVVPCEIDETRRRAVVKTRHLSVLSMLMWVHGWDCVKTDQFMLYFDKKDHALIEMTKEELEKVHAWAEKTKQSPEAVEKKLRILRESKAKDRTGVTYNQHLERPPAEAGPSDGQWPAWCNAQPDLPPFVRDLGVLLDVAFKRYQDAGFRMPDTPINVRVRAAWGTGGKSSRNTATGLIGIGFGSPDHEKLASESSHELFHAIQNQYYWDIGMGGSRLWWIEATAEYAGWTIGAKRKLTQALPGRYLSYPLTQTTSSDTDPHNEHEYQTAHFMDFIAKLGRPSPKSFRAFFEQVVSLDPARGTAPLQDALQPLREGVAATYNKPLYGVYRDFAAWLAFSQDSACDEEPSKIAVHSITLEPPVPGKKITPETWTAELPAGGTARICLVNVKEPGTVQAGLQAKLPADATVDFFLLSGHERTAGALQPVASLSDPTKPVDLPLTPDATLAVLCTNTSASSRTIGVQIGMPAPLQVALTATPAKAGVGSKVLLTAAITGGKPPYRARFTTSGVPGGQPVEPVEGSSAARTATFAAIGPAWAEVTVFDETPKGTPVTKRIPFEIIEPPFAARLEAPEKRSPGQDFTVKLIIEGGEPPFACSGLFNVPETRERELTKETRVKEKRRALLRTTVTDARKRETKAECTILIESSIDVQPSGPKQLRVGQEANIDVTVKGGEGPYQISVKGTPIGPIKGPDGHFAYRAGQMPGRDIVDIQATDAKGESGLGRLNMLVLPAKDGDFTVIVQGPNGAIKRGEQGKFTVTIAGGQYPYRIFVNGKELPGNHGRVVPFTHQPTTRGTVEEVMVLVIDANGGGKLFPREVGVRD